jgi:lipopolysaccharide transport system permease protein
MSDIAETPKKYRFVIKPSRRFFSIDLHEMWLYRDLLWLLVHRDLVALYKQTILGPLWFIIQPLLTTLVFTVIFGNVAKISTDGMPKTLFYMSGIMLWTYFHSCAQNVGTSLVGNAGLFRKVYYPRLVSPLSIVISNLAQFGLNMMVFLCFYFYFLFFTSASIHPTWWLLAIPLLVIESAMIGLGVGLCIAAMTIKYRDLTFAIPFLTQLWMYATPIVYPTSLLSERWRWAAMLNPMASVVEQCRLAFLGTGTLTAGYLICGWVIAFLLLAVGLIVFQRAQRTFVDTL